MVNSLEERSSGNIDKEEDIIISTELFRAEGKLSYLKQRREECKNEGKHIKPVQMEEISERPLFPWSLC